jgi:hypothetical protein
MSRAENCVRTVLVVLDASILLPEDQLVSWLVNQSVSQSVS